MVTATAAAGPSHVDGTPLLHPVAAASCTTMLLLAAAGCTTMLTPVGNTCADTQARQRLHRTFRPCSLLHNILFDIWAFILFQSLPSLGKGRLGVDSLVIKVTKYAFCLQKAAA